MHYKLLIFCLVSLFFSEQAVNKLDPIFQAIQNNNLDTVKKLVTEKNINIPLPKNECTTDRIFHWAAIHTSIDNNDTILKYLLQHFGHIININQLDKNYMSPLDYACGYDGYNSMKVLIAHNARYNYNLLQYIIESTKKRYQLLMLRYLINYGLDVKIKCIINSKDRYNSVITSYYEEYCWSQKANELIRQLIMSGHPIQLSEQEFKNMLQLAHSEENYDLAKLITAANTLTKLCSKGIIDKAFTFSKESGEQCLWHALLFMLDKKGLQKLVGIVNSIENTDLTKSDFIDEFCGYNSPPLIMHLLRTGFLGPNKTNFIHKFTLNSKHPVYQLRMYLAWQQYIIKNDINIKYAY